MAQARAELDAGDLRQASEKAWGAAAQVVKAAAQVRGWDHTSHRGLFLGVSGLTEETGDQEIHDLFLFANGLHQNFYENSFPLDEVSRNIRRTERFIAKIEDILDSPTSNGR